MGAVWSEVGPDGPGVPSRPYCGATERGRAAPSSTRDPVPAPQIPGTIQELPGSPGRTKAGLGTGMGTASPVCSGARHRASNATAKVTRDTRDTAPSSQSLPRQPGEGDSLKPLGKCGIKPPKSSQTQSGGRGTGKAMNPKAAPQRDTENPNSCQRRHGLSV